MLRGRMKYKNRWECDASGMRNVGLSEEDLGEWVKWKYITRVADPK